MSDETKTLAHEAIKTGKSSLIASALKKHFADNNYYRKTYTPPSILHTPPQENDDTYMTALTMFGNET